MLELVFIFLPLVWFITCFVASFLCMSCFEGHSDDFMIPTWPGMQHTHTLLEVRLCFYEEERSGHLFPNPELTAANHGLGRREATPVRPDQWHLKCFGLKWWRLMGFFHGMRTTMVEGCVTCNVWTSLFLIRGIKARCEMWLDCMISFKFTQ